MEPTILKINLVGGIVEFRFYNTREDAINLIKDDLIKEARRLEKIFNFFDDKSELSILNAKRSMIVTEDLRFVLEQALIYAKLTDGEYDISLGKQILERKGKSAQIKSWKDKNKIRNSTQSTASYSYKDIIIEKNKVKITKDDLLIDLGSIAKGYIADKLSEFLQESGIKSGLIDARGDILIFGDAEEIVHVQHPRDETKLIGKIKLHKSAVATSGDYKQFFGSYDKSHILNQKELISVTIVANSLCNADVLASAVFVAKREDRENIIKNAVSSNISVLTVDKNLKINKYNWGPVSYG
jgi:FAD:protein FMN transferase